jgi:large subunit ribosomal protein L28
MARTCQLTGKHAIKGNSISHSNIRTKRLFKANLHTKRFFFTEENRWVTLTLSAKGIKTVGKNGLAAVVKEIRLSGQKV